MSGHGRDEALTELVRTRGTHLTSYAYVLTGDVAAAQDLVQDAVVKYFVRTRSGFGAEVAEAYIKRSITTLYIDTYRRRRHWSSIRHLVATDERRDAFEGASADREDLRRALATLSAQERVAVVLRFYEDLTVPEVAEQMNLAPGTVKRYLSNAMRKLEVRLGALPALHDHTTESTPVIPVADGRRSRS